MTVKCFITFASDLHPLLRGLHHQGRGPVHSDRLQHLRLHFLLGDRQDPRGRAGVRLDVLPPQQAGEQLRP